MMGCGNVECRNVECRRVECGGMGEKRSYLLASQMERVRGERNHLLTLYSFALNFAQRECGISHSTLYISTLYTSTSPHQRFSGRVSTGSAVAASMGEMAIWLIVSRRRLRRSLVSS